MAIDICSSCEYSWWHGLDQELKCSKRKSPKINGAGQRYCMAKMRAIGSDDDREEMPFLDSLYASEII